MLIRNNKSPPPPPTVHMIPQPQPYKYHIGRLYSQPPPPPPFNRVNYSTHDQLSHDIDISIQQNGKCVKNVWPCHVYWHLNFSIDYTGDDKKDSIVLILTDIDYQYVGYTIVHGWQKCKNPDIYDDDVYRDPHTNKLRRRGGEK